MKVGFVSLTGRPNVGKSTLLNAMIDSHLAITSDKAGTTRHVIQGIYNDDDSQIVFVDTPGIAKPIHKMGSVLNKKAYGEMESVDLILLLLDASVGLTNGDERIIKNLKEDTPVILVLNKMDKIPRENLLLIIDEASKLFPFKEIIPVSAKNKKNLKDLLDSIKKYLEEGEPYYKEEEFTNVSTKFLVAELVREKLLRKTREEVPHAITCLVENYREQKDKVYIQVLIVVDRDNLKKIIIGKNGSMLKEVGMEAREDIERLINKKVYLSTFVKTIDNWRDREKYLQELGINDMDE